MKKLFVLFFFVFGFSSFSFADCSQLKQSSDSLYSSISSLQSTYGFYGAYSSFTESSYASDITLAEQRLQTMLDSASFSGFGRSGYVEEQKAVIQSDIDSKKQKLAAYQQYGTLYPQYISASNSYTDCLAKEIIELDPLGFAFNYKKAQEAYNAGEFNMALLMYNFALSVAKNETDKKAANDGISQCKKKLSVSNDPISYVQDYLKMLNVPAAWKNVANSNEVIVAVIDDGININHPDLKGKIWVNPKAEYGASKVIDFVGDKIGDNMPTGQHGTMIAGIIGANTDNNEGIAGIAKNVKLMPLRVFGFDGNALDDNIIRAINYAIDNGASIINLSLGGSQFAPYTDKYDNVIKRAYDKGIIVVIAAGNGDILGNSQTGVDLSINPISPVCNNKGNVEYSLGVAAFDSIGYRALWSNYNGCISFFAPGELIISTSIPVFNSQYGTNYNMGDGTSYAAPMITGIIALGYNQYGWVSPKLVRESLFESLVKNSVGNQVVDASKYLDALKKRLPTIQKEQKTRSQSVDTTSDADILADVGIITKKNTISEYRLESNVLRQEVIGMAIKLAGVTLPTEYTCKNIFRDVSAVKPNNWACRSVEMGVERGIVSGTNKNFNPESNITRAEALAILMNAAGIKTQESTVSKFADVTVPWQINIVNTAFSYSFIDAADSFYPNKNATRGEIFNMAKRILKSKS